MPPCGAGLDLDDGSSTVVVISPALEIGSERRLANGVVVRPYLRGGAVWTSGDDITVGASFADGPMAVGSFTVNAATDAWQAVVAAGFDAVTRKTARSRLSTRAASARPPPSRASRSRAP